jgi:hypothetical protein
VSNRNERTIGGFAGRLVGRAKEALAAASSNDELATEHQVRAAASPRQEAVDAEHQRLGNEFAAARREQRIERDRVRAGKEAARAAGSERGPADAGARSQYSGAERSVRAAERVRLAATEEASRLEREAREANRHADDLDPG